MKGGESTFFAKEQMNYNPKGKARDGGERECVWRQEWDAKKKKFKNRARRECIPAIYVFFQSSKLKPISINQFIHLSHFLAAHISILSL